MINLEINVDTSGVFKERKKRLEELKELKKEMQKAGKCMNDGTQKLEIYLAKRRGVKQ